MGPERTVSQLRREVGLRVGAGAERRDGALRQSTQLTQKLGEKPIPNSAGSQHIDAARRRTCVPTTACTAASTASGGCDAKRSSHPPAGGCCAPHEAAAAGGAAPLRASARSSMGRGGGGGATRRGCPAAAAAAAPPPAGACPRGARSLRRPQVSLRYPHSRARKRRSTLRSSDAWRARSALASRPKPGEAAATDAAAARSSRDPHSLVRATSERRRFSPFLRPASPRSLYVRSHRRDTRQ